MKKINYDIVQINAHSSEDGILICIESNKDIPFLIERLFIIKDVPKNETRGNHASKEARFCFSAISGSITLELTNKNGKTEKKVLDSMNFGIVIDRMTWIKAYNFSSDAVLVVCSDRKYKKSDYIENFDEFRKENKI